MVDGNHLDGTVTKVGPLFSAVKLSLVELVACKSTPKASYVL